MRAFTQAFDSDDLDAAALLVPLVGFLPSSDGLRGGEATFVICSFWLVSALARAGRHDHAERLFEHLERQRESRTWGRGSHD